MRWFRRRTSGYTREANSFKSKIRLDKSNEEKVEKINRLKNRLMGRDLC